jgi:hypothetical protein
MRGTILGLLLPIVLMPQTGRADHGPPTWLFSGTVTSVNDPGGFLGVEVDDPASGRLVWTTTMTQIFDGGTVAFYQEQAFFVIGVRLDVGGVDYEPDPSANVTLQIHDDNATFDDRFSLGDAAVTNDGGLTYSASGLTAVLQDEDQTVFSSTAIPAAMPALGEFESATVSLTLTNINSTSDSASVIVDLTTLEEEEHGTPVPSAAPSGLAILVTLLAAGAALPLRRAHR